MKKWSIKNLKKKRKKSGFTLIELIIVIVIIALLAAMAIPKFSAMRKDALVSNDVAAAKNIQSAAGILVGNGTIAQGTSDTNYVINPSGTDAVSKAICDRVKPNKDSAKLLPEGMTGKKFVVKVDTNGDVTVGVGDTDITWQLQPEKDKKDYAAGTPVSGSNSTGGSQTGGNNGSQTGSNNGN